MVLSRAGAQVNEDALAVTVSSLIIIDGATGLTENRQPGWSSDARWFSHRLTTLLEERLDDISTSIASILATCLSDLRIEFGAEHSTELGPSASVLIARLHGGALDIYSLGDCLALIGTLDGTVHVLRDNAVGNLDSAVVHHLQGVAAAQSMSIAQARPLITDLLVRNRKLKNSPQGYWIADLSGTGVTHALTQTFAASNVRDVALMTDGFGASLDLVSLVTNPAEFLAGLRTIGPTQLMNALFSRLDSDPEYTSYPRLKHIDDSSVIFANVSSWPEAQQQTSDLSMQESGKYTTPTSENFSGVDASVTTGTCTSRVEKSATTVDTFIATKGEVGCKRGGLAGNRIGPHLMDLNASYATLHAH